VGFIIPTYLYFAKLGNPHIRIIIEMIEPFQGNIHLKIEKIKTNLLAQQFENASTSSLRLLQLIKLTAAHK
jgi:hypothetical protein